MRSAQVPSARGTEQSVRQEAVACATVLSLGGPTLAGSLRASLQVTLTDAVALPERPRFLPVPAGFYALSPRVGGPQDVPRFLLDRDLVTVARYARFVAADGYS